MKKDKNKVEPSNHCALSYSARVLQISDSSQTAQSCVQVSAVRRGQCEI